MSGAANTGRAASRADAASGAPVSLTRLLASESFFDELRGVIPSRASGALVWSARDDAGVMTGAPATGRAIAALHSAMRDDPSFQDLGLCDALLAPTPAVRNAATAILEAVQQHGAPVKLSITGKAISQANQAASAAMFAMYALRDQNDFRAHSLALFDRDDLLRRGITDTCAVCAVFLVAFTVFSNDLIAGRRMSRANTAGELRCGILLPHVHAGDDSVVRCKCGILLDDGLEMVQCDECNCWSHVACVSYAPGGDMWLQKVHQRR